MKIYNGLVAERKDNGVRLYDPVNGRAVEADNFGAATQLFYNTYYQPIIEKYKDVDIDKPLKLNLLIDIFQAFTCSCSKGIPVWCDMFPEEKSIAETKGLSIRKVCEMLEEEHGALRFKHIFMHR